jgi:4-hydroxybenzoate polyprenyltransferase
MIFGVVLAAFHDLGALSAAQIVPFVMAFASTCLLASANYVLNEIHDRFHDRHHPAKRDRGVAAGRVRVPIAYVEWIVLTGLALAVAWWVNAAFFMATIAFALAAIAYNVAPLRLKDRPYADVLCESLNNPIRLLLGWFVIMPSTLPSVSLLIAYWFLGAFLMATKRYAEYAHLGDGELAARYRRSFRHYNRNTLLISMFFYVTLFALFCGVFIIRYHFELVLATPGIAATVAAYARVGFKADSAAQRPERIFREKTLMVLVVLTLAAVLLLLFVQIPVLYEWFRVVRPERTALWVL